MNFGLNDIIKLLDEKDHVDSVQLMQSGSDKDDDNVPIESHDSTFDAKTDDVSFTTSDNESTVEVYYPHITRDTISIFEYVGVITKLARYLYSLTNLSKYISEIEVNQIINPAELAYHLLKSGKFDAVIDRGYERVTFSVLKIKPQWQEMIENYFTQQHEVVQNELLQPYNLV